MWWCWNDRGTNWWNSNISRENSRWLFRKGARVSWWNLTWIYSRFFSRKRWWLHRYCWRKRSRGTFTNTMNICHFLLLPIFLLCSKTFLHNKTPQLHSSSSVSKKLEQFSAVLSWRLIDRSSHINHNSPVILVPPVLRSTNVQNRINKNILTLILLYSIIYSHVRLPISKVSSSSRFWSSIEILPVSMLFVSCR